MKRALRHLSQMKNVLHLLSDRVTEDLGWNNPFWALCFQMFPRIFGSSRLCALASDLGKFTSKYMINAKKCNHLVLGIIVCIVHNNFRRRTAEWCLAFGGSRVQVKMIWPCSRFDLLVTHGLTSQMCDYCRSFGKSWTCFRKAQLAQFITPNKSLDTSLSLLSSTSFVFCITIVHVDYDRQQDCINLVGSTKLCNQQAQGSFSWFHAQPKSLRMTYVSLEFHLPNGKPPRNYICWRGPLLAHGNYKSSLFFILFLCIHERHSVLITM